MVQSSKQLDMQYVPISVLKTARYNPRVWSKDAITQLTNSIKKFGLVDPILVNGATKRKNIVIGGHFRLKVARDLGFTTVPVVFLNIPSEEREKELNLRLNKNTGDWDWNLLSEFDESFLENVGFSSEELDEVFDIGDEHEVFDLEKELKKLNIEKVSVKKGDIFQLGGSKLMCGDSTVANDFNKLTTGEKADMCLTDPPYILDYLRAKRHGKPTRGFGFRKDRRYLETDVLPDNFTELWMKNVANAAKPDFSIIVYENWKNLRIIWAEMEKYWQVKNMVVWHIPNRHQGFAADYKFFSKHDIAMVGGSGKVPYNIAEEKDGLQEEYETALYAISGKPQWEGYEHGKKYLPTDFIEFQANDAKHSGQNIVFGTKPVEILIPYIKVLTKRGDLILEPYGGSGSTLIAATQMKRRCFVMEKSPVYAEVIMKRWEKFTGLKREKLS